MNAILQALALLLRVLGVAEDIHGIDYPTTPSPVEAPAPAEAPAPTRAPDPTTP